MGKQRELTDDQQELVERIRSLAEQAHDQDDHDTEHSLLIVARAIEKDRAEEVYMCLSMFGPLMRKMLRHIKPLMEKGQAIVAQLTVGGIDLDLDLPKAKRPGPKHGPPADPSLN